MSSIVSAKPFRAGRARATLALATASIALLAIGATPGSAEISHASAIPTPVIKRVSPMRVKVGRMIAIRGRGFSATRKRNKVIFKAKNGRLALGRVTLASRRRLVLRVPASVELVLTKKASIGVPTRVYLRVVTSRYGKRSIKRHSPVIVSALRRAGTATCGKRGSTGNATC